MDYKRLIFIPFLVLTLWLNAATYYVAPSTATPAGNDANEGTIAAPWLTWQKAFTTVSAGDSVIFRGGIYYATSQITSTKDGTRGDPIVYINYTGEEPILDYVNRTSPGIGLYFNDANNIKLKGLTVRNNHQIAGFTEAENNYVFNVYFYSCNNVTVEQCQSYNSGRRAFYSYEGDTLTFYKCDAWNNADSLAAAPGNGGDGFLIWDNGEVGDSISYVVLRQCRSWNNSDDGYDIETEGYIEADSCWAWGNGYLAYGNGMGFKYGLKNNQTTILTKKITNCISTYNKYWGFVTNDANGYAQTMNIYNNISYKNAIGYAVYNTISTDAFEDNRIYRNNVAYDNPTAVSRQTIALWTSSNNSWDAGVTVTSADFVSVDSSVLNNARQADGSLPVSTFLTLTANSDMIDNGIDVGIAYSGDAPDLGYYEYPQVDVLAPMISTNYPTAVHSIQATSGGYMINGGGGDVTAKGVCYSKLINPDVADSTILCGTGTADFTATISGLKASTTYHVRAYATNSEGTSYGADESFTTSARSTARIAGKTVRSNGKTIMVR